ncbi:hypothetical protein D3C75_1073510 [compost metagenome]
MILGHHIQFGGFQSRFQLGNAFEAGNAGADSFMLKAPGNRPLGHIHTLRNLPLPDIRYLLQPLVRCFPVPAGANVILPEYGSRLVIAA